MWRPGKSKSAVSLRRTKARIACALMAAGGIGFCCWERSKLLQVHGVAGNLNVSHTPSIVVGDFEDVVEPGMRWASGGPYTNNSDVVSFVYSMQATVPEMQTQNILFFLRHGLQTNVDYVFIVNGPAPRAVIDAIPKLNNIFIIHKDNSCYDLGSHPIGVDFAEKKTGKRYQRFALLNSSVRGPFLPQFVKGCWYDQFLALLDEKVKLIGTVHGCLETGTFMMQSMALGYDRVGFDIALKGTLVCRETHEKTWMIGEAGNLQRMKDAGYEGRFLAADSALRRETCTPGNEGDSGFRYGEHQPTEILFWKTNRGQAVQFLKKITSWHDNLPSACPYHIPAAPRVEFIEEKTDDGN